MKFVKNICSAIIVLLFFFNCDGKKFAPLEPEAETFPKAEFTYKLSQDREKIIIVSNTSSADSGDTLVSYKWFLNYRYLPEFDNELTPTFEIVVGYQYAVKLRVTDNHSVHAEKITEFWVLDD